MKLNKYTALCFALFLAACSPKGEVIPPDPNQWGALGEKVKSLKEEDRRLLGAYLARKGVGAAFAGGKIDIPLGQTVGKAIAEQRSFEANQKKQEAEAQILAAKAAAQRAAAEAKLNSAALVSLVSKGVLPEDIYNGRYSARVTFVFAVQNRTEKDIVGIKGSIEFIDLFGTTIKKLNISMDEDIKAGQTRTISGYGKDINEFIDEDVKLANTEQSKLKAVFHPNMIVFSDGTNISTPEIKGE